MNIYFIFFCCASEALCSIIFPELSSSSIILSLTIPLYAFESITLDNFNFQIYWHMLLESNFFAILILLF